MNYKSPQLWIGVCSIAAVLTLALVDSGKTSPGALTSVHGREPDLAESDSCSSCHGGWGTSMAEACLDCHELIAEQIGAGEGLHGTFDSVKSMACAMCHSEHHGAGFAIVNRQSFALAGVADPAEFDHELVGFLMGGQHLEQECSKCHENADTEVLLEGALRYGGLDQDCSTCHDDAHEGTMQLGCVTCHGQESFEQLVALDHDKYLPLLGGHAERACRDCHAKDGKHSLETIGARSARVRVRQCTVCHEAPHDRKFIAGVAKLESVANPATCVLCHEHEHDTFRDVALELTTAQHARSGFQLIEPHAERDCEDCHDPELDFVGRYPGRRADSCASCHDDPHAGQFDEGPFAADGCIACHDRKFFEPHAFDDVKHAKAALPLSGAHLERECNVCHEDPVDGDVREFRGTPARCELCHEDAHEEFFEPFKDELSATEFGDCRRCHLTTTFEEIPEEKFDHAYWTQFGIKGAHAEAQCGICHTASDEPDHFGRSFGRVSELFGEFEGCVTCHADPHYGIFDGPDRPQQVADQEGCLRCHVETSFRAIPGGFDHTKWTGFELRGEHSKISCTECHSPVREHELGRTMDYSRGIECTDCHSDPHGGQFEEEGWTDCARCHTDTADFYKLIFNHEWDSRFSLGEAHTELACSICHQPVAVADDIEIVRFKPLGTDCADCHGVHDDPLRKRKGRNK